MCLCVYMLPDLYTQQYVCTFIFCCHIHLYIYDFSSIYNTMPLTAYSYIYTILTNISGRHRCLASMLYSALRHGQQASSSHIGVGSYLTCA